MKIANIEMTITLDNGASVNVGIGQDGTIQRWGAELSVLGAVVAPTEAIANALIEGEFLALYDE